MTTRALDYKTKPISKSISKTAVSRLAYIDNLRIFLTILVILHHLSIGYGAPGGWYYDENGNLGTVSMILMTLFVAVNQSFFMGFFFMISSYFLPGSYDRKGSAVYIRERLKRLGIPLVIFFLFINPVLKYILWLNNGSHGSLWRFFTTDFENYGGFSTGPLWFVTALLLFSFIYVIWRKLTHNRPSSSHLTFPKNKTIIIITAILGLLTFIIRVWIPVGKSIDTINFQLAHFVQYTALFTTGIIAYRNKWFSNMPISMVKKWSKIALGLVLIFFVILITGGALDGKGDLFMGGMTWQSLAYAIWEQYMGVAMIVILLGLFRQKITRQGGFARSLSSTAYTAYIIHALVITTLAIALSGYRMEMGLKFLLVAPIALASTFTLAALIKKLPFTKGIL